MDWLSRSLTANGVTVAVPLDPNRLVDTDLRAICARMHAILDTIEMPRCEGRLLPAGLFDSIDTLADRLRHGPPPKLADWVAVVQEFETYYGLVGAGPITVELEYWRKAALLVGTPGSADQ